MLLASQVLTELLLHASALNSQDMTGLLQHLQQLPDDQVQELLNAAKAST